MEKSLQRLQPSMGPGSSSLLVGIFHAFWHLPLFWVAGTNQIAMGFGLDFLLYLVMVVALAVITGWCYLGNGHSTLAATLLHTTGNLCFDIFVMTPGTPKERFFVLLVALAAVGILGWWRTGWSESLLFVFFPLSSITPSVTIRIVSFKMMVQYLWVIPYTFTISRFCIDIL